MKCAFLPLACPLWRRSRCPYAWFVLIRHGCGIVASNPSSTPNYPFRLPNCCLNPRSILLPWSGWLLCCRHSIRVPRTPSALAASLFSPPNFGSTHDPTGGSAWPRSVVGFAEFIAPRAIPFPDAHALAGLNRVYYRAPRAHRLLYLLPPSLRAGLLPVTTDQCRSPRVVL